MKCTMNALTKQVNPSHIVSAGDATPKRLCPSAKKKSSSQSLSGMLDETLHVQLKVANRRAASQPRYKETKLSDFHEFSKK